MSEKGDLLDVGGKEESKKDEVPKDDGKKASSSREEKKVVLSGEIPEGNLVGNEDEKGEGLFDHSGSSKTEEVCVHSRKQGSFAKFVKLGSALRLSFSGSPDDDLKSFLRDYLIHYEESGIGEDEAIRALKYFLKGRALDWFVGRRDRYDHLSELCDALLKQFLPDHEVDGARVKLQNLHQENDESLGRFIDILLKKNALLMRPLKASEVASVIKNNMTRRYKLQLGTSLASMDLESLEDAAVKLDPLLCPDQNRKKESTSKEGRPRVDAVEISSGTGDRRPPRRCFICSETNHIAKDCKKKKTMQCWICGGPHRKFECPKQQGRSTDGNQSTDTGPRVSAVKTTAEQPLSDEALDKIAKRVAEHLKSKNP